jgi:CubicO group peptidase (beta-lactamase class C family)
MSNSPFPGRGCFALLTALLCGSAQGAAQETGPGPAMARGLLVADSLLADAVARERIPGAVLVITRAGDVIHERAFGYAQLYDYGMRRLAEPRPLRTSTVFDLASVTKVMATTYALMLLVDRGLVDVDAPVHRYLPEFRGARLDSITVRHLLTHSAGLHQWQPVYYDASTPAQAYDVIRSLPLPWGVGEGRHYSDLGFMLLGRIIERVSGRTLDAFVREEVYEPLGLQATTFRPGEHGLTDFAATSHGNPYERRMVHDTAFGYDYEGDPDAWSGWREYTLSGEVNDGNAWYAYGGVAGHAGLFSTARELSMLLDVLLERGTRRGRRIMSPDVIDTFMQRDRFGHALGWQIPRDAPQGSFAHNGFTGTYVIGVPQYRLGIVLLINRQNLGTDERGFYPRLDVQQEVIRAILEGAAR